MRFTRYVATCFLLLCAPFSRCSSADERADNFEKHVRPLLIEHCVKCHGPKKQESGIRLDSRQHVLEGTDDFEALISVDAPSDSRLLQVIAWHDDDVQMPPEQQLSEDTQSILRHWVEQGAIWPESSAFGQTTDTQINWKEHWAFQPVRNPQPPEDGHPVDAFIRRRLLTDNIAPSPKASARVLVRRLSVALTGLPPDVEDLDAAAQLADADTARWIDEYATRLLASPHFGERWARYWLDVARYSDTKGYVFQEDRNYPDAWRYREWVIKAFNSDMPWDEFLTRQLAADRFPDEQTPEDLAAMGFLTLGRRFLNNIHDIIDDRIDVTMRGMMGLTVACARCHDHKYDPVPTADYYSLYGVFHSSDEPKDEPSPLRLVDSPQPREPVVFIRGSAGRRGERVPRQFLTAFVSGEPQPFTDGSGRLEMARAIANRDNPLTARVAVNRIWGHLFGNPLVNSPSDFGMRSDPPTHPDLLDHLATWFMDHDWSVKQLIRYIVTSETWQQTSHRRADIEDVDPDNRLLARMLPARLDFEAHRDALLSASGLLDRTIGGESASITSQPFTARRTVYAHIDRQNLPGVFRAFDFASPDTHAPQRYQTTVPQQALFQLNSPFVLHVARAAAVATEDSANAATGVSRLYRRILQRDPEPHEVEAAQEFVQTDVEDAPSGWSYGYGSITENSKRLVSFRLLPAFHENSWRGGETLPDSTLDWVSLRKTGGHPGKGRSLCAVRRWTAGQGGTVSIQTRFRHKNEQGDGVTLIVFHNQQVVLATQTICNGREQLEIKDQSMGPGDTVDFVVFSGDSTSHDTFECSIDINETTGAGSRLWSSVNDFSNRNEPQVTDAWTQLAQVLMLTNEFVFVD